MKKYAFFLPQFHRIKENDAWWGEGFTEWVNVRRAKPLFKGHIQPIHPLDSRYYNLLEKETVEWQTDLMKKYNIDGLIYYHYYFKGKTLLEKPAENLLKWKEIDQNFFFCWANHDWNRAWNGSREVIQKQEYGSEDDWNAHFEYLLPFFKDQRYQKKDNKPLFMIYKSDFQEKEKMFLFFNKKCIENGFGGLYLIETYTGSYLPEYGLKQFRSQISSVTNKIFFRELNVSCKTCYSGVKALPYVVRNKIIKKFKIEHLEKLDGNKLYRSMLKEKKDEDIIHGIFFEWDNTPRHGKRGYIVSPPSKEIFVKVMNHFKEEEYIFINAWNEWAEGMVLEPTVEKGYTYLEWIKEWDDNNYRGK